MKYVLIGLGLALAAGNCLVAQQPPGDNVLYLNHAGVPGGGQVQIEYIAAEFGSAVVKGSPYSAEAITEATQTLADGNRIVQKNSALIYRDSQGRTRREQTLGAIGPLAVQSTEPLKVITISDPVAGVSYTLNPQSQTAAKIPLNTTIPHAAPGGGVMMGHAESGMFELPLPEPQAGAARTETLVRTVIRHGEGPQQGKTEQLGRQTIDGVEVEGTRETTTIPAGQMGNERPIEIVSERWYSPRLQAVVMSRRSDPRMGETIYRLSNISLGEPPASLFQVPSGYTVKEGSDKTMMWVEKRQQ
jgi:hypothetical protein